MKIIISKSIVIIFMFLLCSCVTGKKLPWENKRFEAYLTARDIEFIKQQDGDLYNELGESFYETKHYDGFIANEKKLRLDANPYIKINKVYVHYRTPTSVEFVIYSDDERFCLSTFDLDMDGKILSFPENGIVKVLEPIVVKDFGGFRINENNIIERTYNKSPYKKWYNYLEGTITNDTIHFTKKYVGTNMNKYKKRWLSKTRKANSMIIYQPNLKAKKYKDEYDFPYFEVTGEFKVDQSPTSF